MARFRLLLCAVAMLAGLLAAPAPSWAARDYARLSGRPSMNPGFRQNKFGSRYNYKIPRVQRLPGHTRYTPGPRRPAVQSGYAR